MLNLSRERCIRKLDNARQLDPSRPVQNRNPSGRVGAVDGERLAGLSCGCPGGITAWEEAGALCELCGALCRSGSPTRMERRGRLSGRLRDCAPSGAVRPCGHFLPDIGLPCRRHRDLRRARVRTQRSIRTGFGASRDLSMRARLRDVRLRRRGQRPARIGCRRLGVCIRLGACATIRIDRGVVSTGEQTPPLPPGSAAIRRSRCLRILEQRQSGAAPITVRRRVALEASK